MSNKLDMLSILNSANLAQNMSKVQQALLLHAAGAITALSKSSEDKNLTQEQIERQMLDSVGPAAAAAAVEYTINTLQKTKKQFLNIDPRKNSFVTNMSLAKNEGCYGGENPDWGNTMRNFLLPRYAYLDFDNIVDPRHKIDEECGYPKFITPIMYRYMYDRDDMAKRVNDIYPDECWAAEPKIYEDDNEEVTTPFEIEMEELIERFNLMQYLYRIDKACGIGHYGVLLMGINDGRELDEPIEGCDEWYKGVRNIPQGPRRDLLYLRPFDEYLSFIQEYDIDTKSPRYGMPVIYNLVFVDMTIDAAGASIGTRLNRRVHWSRVIHVADNPHTSNVFGIPRMQPVFNRLLDLRKIKGGSAEMFWKGAFPGISFEIDPRFVTDEVEFDRDKFRQEIENYANGLQRYLTTLGVSAKSLSPQIADPDKHVNIQVQAIASHAGIPLRIFLGSEESRLASSQDKLTWNQRLSRKIRSYVNPVILRASIDRFILTGVVVRPKDGKYFTDWSDLNTTTDEDKANLALKWTQALSQYVASGVFHLIQPLDYLTLIMGLTPRDALRIDKEVKANGGWAKLKAVDPSQGAGVNGKRENITDSKDSNGKAVKRDKADKEIEGKSS